MKKKRNDIMSEDLVDQVENMKHSTGAVIEEFVEAAEDDNDSNAEETRTSESVALTVRCVHPNCREMFASEADRDTHVAHTCVATKIGSKKANINDIWREKGHATSYHIRQCAGARGSISAMMDAARNQGGEEVVCGFGGPRNYPSKMIEEAETRAVDKEGKLPFEVAEAQEYHKKKLEENEKRLAMLKAKADAALANLDAEKQRQKLALAKELASSDSANNDFVTTFGVPMNKKTTNDTDALAENSNTETASVSKTAENDVEVTKDDP